MICRFSFKKGCVAICMGMAFCAAQGSEQDVYPIVRKSVQIGVDAWHLSPREPDPLIALANNTTWSYRSVSPWLKIDGSVWLSNQLAVNVRARADRNLGTHIDEMLVSWSISPNLGLHVGVVSYKTTWCRTYETDSPWVREVNPFCTVSTTSDSVGGAPGLAVNSRFELANYLVQAEAGIYRPLAFNYNTTEFSTAPYPNATIYQNNKKGASVSVLNLDNATELRLGYLYTTQAEHVGATATEESFRNQQSYDVVFLGGSYYLAPGVYLRAQTMRHNMTSSLWSEPWSQWPSYRGGVDLLRSSNALELGYQKSPQDTVAFAVSEYLYENSFRATKYPFAGYNYHPNNYVYKNTSLAISWRRNWDAHFFTALQLTRNSVHLKTPSKNSIDPPSYSDLGAYGLGLRLGYQF